MVGLGDLYGALVGRELGEEAVINFRSEPKETSVKAAKDQRNFVKGRGIDTGNVVGLKEERERPDARKRKKLLLPVLLLHPALQKACKKSALV